MMKWLLDAKPDLPGAYYRGAHLAPEAVAMALTSLSRRIDALEAELTQMKSKKRGNAKD